MYRHLRILIHGKGSTDDTHIPDAVNEAIELAYKQGVKAESVTSLLEIKRRLLLDSNDEWAADAALSADSTKNILAACRDIDPITFFNPLTGEIEALKSPLAAILPTVKPQSHFILTDAGAHTGLESYQIALGALLCGSFWRAAFQKGKHPRYGVFGYGEEVSKLPPESREAYDFLRTCPNRTVKVVEAKEAFKGSAEVVVVRNGEIGNTILKTAEAVLECFKVVVKEEMKADLFSMAGGVLSRSAFDRTKERIYHADTHGAFVLACGKPFMKQHGRLGAEDIYLALMRLARYTKDGVIARTRQDFFEEIRKSHPMFLPALSSKTTAVV